MKKAKATKRKPGMVERKLNYLYEIAEVLNGQLDSIQRKLDVITSKIEQLAKPVTFVPLNPMPKAVYPPCPHTEWISTTTGGTSCRRCGAPLPHINIQCQSVIPLQPGGVITCQTMGYLRTDEPRDPSPEGITTYTGDKDV